MLTPTTPWNIYAEQLFPLGYGHPLWHPEPGNGREVHIGDVGWLSEGAFNPLFNSTQPRHHPLNERLGVPDPFSTFDLDEVLVGERIKISQPMVCSRSIRTRAIEASMGLNASA